MHCLRIWRREKSCHMFNTTESLTLYHKLFNVLFNPSSWIILVAQLHINAHCLVSQHRHKPNLSEEHKSIESHHRITTKARFKSTVNFSYLFFPAWSIITSLYHSGNQPFSCSRHKVTHNLSIIYFLFFRTRSGNLKAANRESTDSSVIQCEIKLDAPRQMDLMSFVLYIYLSCHIREQRTHTSCFTLRF